MGRRQAAASGGGGGGGEDSTNISCAESLIGRLDQLDHRLRQLEEKQTRPAEMYFTVAEDLRPTMICSSSGLSTAAAALHHHQVHLKGNLMDRLRLLETRIRQLSSELEKGNSSSDAHAAGSLTTTTMAIQPEEEDKKKKKKKQNNTRVAGAPWRASEIFHKGALELQAHKSKTKAKGSKLEPTVDAMKKSAMCRDDKRSMERTRFYKRWFPVGC